MKREDLQCLAHLIIEWGQTTKQRGGDELRLLEAAAWLAWDVGNGAKITDSLRKALLGYKAARDGRIHDAMLQATVEMANERGLPKTIELSRRQADRLVSEGAIFSHDAKGRPIPETAYDAASRLLGSTPNGIRKRLARKRKAPSKR